VSDVDANTLGTRVREARERAGLKQGELAGLVGLDRTVLNKVEAGARKVTALELSDIAQALGVRMSSFFDEPLPALVAHRSSQGLDTTDSKIDRLLAGLSTEVEFVQSLAPQELRLNEAALRAGALPYPHPNTHVEAEELAVRVRTSLEFKADEPITDLVSFVAAVGLMAFSFDLGADTADAGTILSRDGGVCLVNSYNKIGRRRLALAHELGHYLVADEYTIDWRVASQNGDIEARLDRFARALLLPEAGLRAAWPKYLASHEVREAAVLTASEYRVDMATLARRLREVGLIDSNGAALIRQVSTTRADIIEFGLNVPREMEGTTLPVVFQKAVLRLFRDERISRERALMLLQGTFDEDDLPARRPRREDEIWTFVS
jgi:Zn-dependent peptidase ImmA (M78 family)/DNA-binding XRE family transcriptional regulator